MQRLRILLVVTTLVLASGLALAQTGSIQGTVTDKSGAVVQDAEVTTRNLETNATRVVSTSATGGFSVTNLPVGNYEVSATKQGFKTFKVPNITLTVAQVLTVDAVLDPGAVTEEVQVRGDELPPVDLETSQVSNIVDSKKMLDLPLLTRDPYSLILLSPGTIQTNSGLGGFSVNGSRERDNNFLLDGSDNNDTSVPGIAGGLASLNPDSTEEFRVITNNFMPEYGRNNGAIVDVVIKSGTNNLHGGARWFGRWDTLGARDYFNHNIDPVTNTMEKQNPYTRNQFGFNIGGPIIKNKTFFFYDMEWSRFRTTVTDTSIVPNPAFKSALSGGTFPYVDPNGDDCTPNPAPCTLTIDLAGGNNNFGFPYDPLMGQIMGLYKDPNAGAVDQFRGLLNFPSTSRYNSTNITTKLDHRFTDREVLSVHAAYDWYKDPDGFHDEFLPGLGATASQSHVTLIGASLTSTIRPTIVNEARFGFNRNDNPFDCSNLDVLNSFGVQDIYGRSRDFSLPSIAGFGCLPLGDSNGQFRRTGTWSWGDTLSWVKGGHIQKFGVDFRRVYENGFDSFFSRDVVTFSGWSNFGIPFVSVNTNLPPCDPFGFILPAPANPSDPFQNCGTTVLQNMSSMLYGFMDTENQSQFFDKSGTRTSDDARQFRQHEYDFFWQDSWKVRPNLTLNFGLRYQFNGVPFEINNNFSNLFQNPSLAAPALDPNTTPGCSPGSPCNGFTFSLVGPGTGHLLYNNDYKDFEPRVGFAWDPMRNGRMSVRGAFGIFHDRVFGNLFGNARGNPPFQQSPFTFPWDTPENVTIPGTVVTSPYVLDGAGFFPTILRQHFPMPETYSWNFGFQRELLRDLTIDLNYIGNHGIHQLRVIDGNPPQPGLVAANLAAGTPADALQFTSLWFGGAGLTSVNNNAFFQAGVNVPIGSSSYNAFQANVNKRFSRGFQIQGAYTFAHAIDDSNDPLVPGEASNRSFPRNSFELYNERGNSSYDIRQRLVINYAWELPVGRGKSYLSSGFVGRAFEGWQLSGITTLQTGHPYDIFYNVDVEHTGLSGRGTMVATSGLSAGHDRTQTGLPLSDFCVAELPVPCSPPFGVPGNVSRNRFYGPGYNNWDIVMSKDTAITERVKLQFRTEVYNIFNRTQFGQPDNLLQDTGTFGFSTSTVGRPDGTTSARQLQFGLKLSF